MHWTRLFELDRLIGSDRAVVKAAGRQIAVFRTERGLYACNNRCPHEGYPLKEGSISDGCVLTCNWHNWKFDLESGETLVGGDSLRRYPVEVRDGAVWADLSEPPAEEQIAQALRQIGTAVEKHEYDRIARELARLARSGGDPLEAVRQTILARHERFEFGTSHAVAAAADWLNLRGRETAADRQLVALQEILGHISWDSLREHRFPYPEERQAFRHDALVDAIESENESAAAALVRGALDAGLGFDELEPALTEAALAHYQDFGHSLIYTLKTGQLIRQLGPGSAEPLLLMLTRSLIYASREDLIPEFRRYAPRREAWGKGTIASAAIEDFRALGVGEALDAVVTRSMLPAEVLYRALLGANAWNMLHFDLSHQSRADNAVAHNVGWLDFTHGITFANAVRHQCSRFPELWPAGLLQMACFAGRNAPYVNDSIELADWLPEDPDMFFQEATSTLFDHGNPEYIVSCHLVKVLTAVREEYEAAPDSPAAPLILAATNRFLNSPLKRKHTLRVARQSLDFVAREAPSE